MKTPPSSTDGLDVLRAFFDIAPDAMIAADHDGRIVLANAQAEKLFGYERGAMETLQLEALLPESLRNAHIMHRRGYMNRPRVRPMGIGYELMGVKHDGHQFPVEIGLSPVGTAQGRIAIASIRDISETRRVRQALERARRDTFVVQIGRLVLESPDYELAIRRIPELVVAALGVPAAAILSSSWQRNDAFHIRAATGLLPTTTDALTSIFGSGEFVHRAFEEGHRDPITSQSDTEATFIIREGLARTRYHHFALVPLFGRHEPLGILIALTPEPRTFDGDKLNFLQSVANLLAAAVQRSRTEEQLAHAQRLEAVGQLTGGIAHDFNNLLTVVSGNLQLLEAELPENAQAQEVIDSALRAVDRGSELTRKLLAFARRQPLKPSPVMPKPLLDELGRMLARTLGEAIAIEIECAKDVPDVYADPNELDTALVNLALNARDAMARGGRLTLAAHALTVDATGNDRDLAPGRYVVFTVADTGTGMSPEVQARALEPFFTTKGTGKGSGLGLSMVYGFVQQSGGRMGMDSRLGYGTRIKLILPAARAASGPRTQAPSKSHAASGHETILVVEDEAEVRAVAVAFLRAMGYEVLVAESAREALEVLANAPRVDLLFSDVVLGSGMNGVELAHEAKRTQPRIAVLLTSGYQRPAPGQNDPASGFELLRKPYRREELATAIRGVLDSA
jgi:PAS domain S-box-containing protein